MTSDSNLTRTTFSQCNGIMNLYNAKVLSYAECRTGAIYNSRISALETLDKV